MSDIVRVHYYITKREDAAAVMTVAGEVLGDIRPAATLLICELLEEAMLIEIEVTARRAM
jgi:enamine deaminase RidA (YjgF/YER057c/UK114 family)